eukprot:4275-Eustigmatos_ZCMA.PRE.1
MRWPGCWFNLTCTIVCHRQFCHTRDLVYHLRHFMSIESMAVAAQISKTWQAVLGPLLARAWG